MAEKKRMRLSSRGRRFAAFAIDEALPMILGIIMCVAATRLAGSVSVYNEFQSYGVDGNAMYSQMQTYSAQSAITITVCCILLLAYLIVEIVFYSKSQSIGKAILGMKVVNSKNGNPIGIWWMLLREVIVKDASLVCCGLGFIWILIDNRNRAWHDKILDTYVVDVEKAAQPVVETAAPAAPVAPVAPAVEAEPAVEVVEPAVEVVEPVVEAEPVAEVEEAAAPVVEAEIETKEE